MDYTVKRSSSNVSCGYFEKKWTEQLIREKQEFVVNIPNIKLINKVIQCGKVSCREVDKIKKFGIHISPASKVSIPLIKECFAHLECKVEKWITTVDHTFFVVHVLTVNIQKNLFKRALQVNLDDAKKIHHLGRSFFTLPGDLLEREKTLRLNKIKNNKDEGSNAL